MKLRSAIYPFSLFAFTPALIQVSAVTIILLPGLFNVSALSYLGLLPLLLVAGGGIGLASALLVTFDIGGSPILESKIWLKRFGLAIGIISQLVVIYMFEPVLEGTSSYFWLPQLLGALMLMVLSFCGATKNHKQRGGQNAASSSSPVAGAIPGRELKQANADFLFSLMDFFGLFLLFVITFGVLLTRTSFGDEMQLYTALAAGIGLATLMSRLLRQLSRAARVKIFLVGLWISGALYYLLHIYGFFGPLS